MSRQAGRRFPQATAKEYAVARWLCEWGNLWRVVLKGTHLRVVPTRCFGVQAVCRSRYKFTTKDRNKHARGMIH